MFYPPPMRVEYREEACRSALNRVKGMPFGWTLNLHGLRAPHVLLRPRLRAARRPTGRRPLRAFDPGEGERGRGLAQGSAGARGRGRPWPSAPAEIRISRGGAYRPDRRYLEGSAGRRRRSGSSRAADRPRRRRPPGGGAPDEGDVTFSVPTLDRDIWRRTEPGTAPPQQRLRALTALVDAGIEANVGMAPILPGLSDGAEQLGAVVRAARAAGATGIWANVLTSGPARKGTSSSACARLAGAARALRGAVRLRRLSAPYAGGSGPRTGTGAGASTGCVIAGRGGSRRRESPGTADSGRVSADRRNTLPRRCPTRSPA